MSGVGSSPALATCVTSQVLLAGVSGGFPGLLPFRPPVDGLVSMSEIILKGTLNWIIIKNTHTLVKTRWVQPYNFNQLLKASQQPLLSLRPEPPMCN